MEIGNLIFGHSAGGYPLPRDEWQELFFNTMNEIGIDGYGYLESDKLKEFETDRGGFENDVFKINPYYWGDDEEIAYEPNFVFKPTGLEINWYKYPLRDSYSNMKISFEEFKEILQQCKDSVKK